MPVKRSAAAKALARQHQHIRTLCLEPAVDSICTVSFLACAQGVLLVGSSVFLFLTLAEMPFGVVRMWVNARKKAGKGRPTYRIQIKALKTAGPR